MAIDFTPDTIDFTPDTAPGINFVSDVSPYNALKAESYAAEGMREDVRGELADARGIQRLLEQTLPPEQARVSANALASSRFDELIQQIKQPVGVKPPPELQLKEDYRTILKREVPGSS